LKAGFSLVISVSRLDSLFSVLGVVACVVIVTIAARLDPDPRGHGTHEQLGLAPCEFLRETGKPCLSCGMTTAFAAMAHARVGAALDANPYGAALFIVVALAPIWFVDSIRRRASPFRFLFEPRRRWILPVAALLLLINWTWMLFRVQ
jgi:hypothetical protein